MAQFKLFRLFRQQFFKFIKISTKLSTNVAVTFIEIKVELYF